MDHAMVRQIAAEVAPDLLIEDSLTPMVAIRREAGGGVLYFVLPQDLPGQPISMEARQNIVRETLKAAYARLPEPSPPPPDPAELQKMQDEHLLAMAAQRQAEDDRIRALINEALVAREELARKRG